MSWNPTTTVILIYIALVALSTTFPHYIVAKVIMLAILASVAYGVLQHGKTSEDMQEVQTETLRQHVTKLMASGYEKNNENVPLRLIKRFRYIFLEGHMVELLVELLRYEARYKDVVNSVFFYSEAFVRQVFRMMEGKVDDAHQARTLAERLLNHLHTLTFNASRYEQDHMQDLTQRLTALVWRMYKQALDKIGQTHIAHTPSPVDPHTDTHFDLQLL